MADNLGRHRALGVGSVLLALYACSTTPPLTEGAQRVQILAQSNGMIASCKRLGPISATVDKVLPASEVYTAAVAEARERAAAMGADSMIVLNSDHAIRGLANAITVHVAALKCY